MMIMKLIYLIWIGVESGRVIFCFVVYFIYRFIDIYI